MTDGPESAPVGQWALRGACRTSDPEALFVQGAAQNRAKLVCMSCPVRTECLSDALDHRIEFGVWGGMTERERRALLRRRPTVKSWRKLLETARAQQIRIVDLLDRQAPPTPRNDAPDEDADDEADSGPEDFVFFGPSAASTATLLRPRSRTVAAALPGTTDQERGPAARAAARRRFVAALRTLGRDAGTGGRLDRLAPRRSMTRMPPGDGDLSRRRRPAVFPRPPAAVRSALPAVHEPGRP